MDLRIGCSGWSYRGWINNFYPQGTKPGNYLKLYSRVFDSVEIDSTFYRIPSISMVKAWHDATPEGFVFTAKMPGEITHERRLADSGDILDRFISVIRELAGKLGMILIQLSPSFDYSSGMKNLRRFLPDLPQDLNFAVEFRHNSWFNDDALALLQEYSVTNAWSEIPGVHNNFRLTTPGIYLRLVGDRSIQEETFGTVQKDRTSLVREWAGKVNERKDEVRHAFIFANNHFQGFGPFTVNLFKESMGLEPADWKSINSTQVPDRQKTLF